MKTLIVGGGAIGGLLAQAMVVAGVDTVILDVSDEVVASISKRGLLVRTDDGEDVVPVSAVTSIAGLDPFDVVFIQVKAHQTESAANSIMTALESSPIVVSLQNGWGNAETLMSVVTEPRLVVGVTYNSATVLSPGLIAHTNRGGTIVGGFGRGTADDAQAVAELANAGGLQTVVTERVLDEIWKKLILNAAALPVSALTGLNVGQMASQREVMALVDDLAAEAVDVATAQGLAIDLEERLDVIHHTLEGGGHGRPSMLQDVDAPRKTEVEVVNGAVVRAADSVGVPAPLNRAMVHLIHGLEAGWNR